MKSMKTVGQLADLSGRKALVTGGAGHIALAIEQALTEMGARVAVLDRSQEDCDKRAKELSKKGKKPAVAIACDLLDEPKTRAAVRRAIKEMGGLDIFFHTAAYVGSTKVSGWGVPFKEQAVKAWDEAIRVNVTAPFIMVQEAKEALEKSGKGSVVLIASTYGLVGPDMRLYEGTSMSNPVGYGVSKGGIIQLTRYLATLLAPRVRANTLTPGGVWRGYPEAFHDRYKAKTPLGRMATEEDFKGAALFLASDLSAYMTGQNLVMDGGWTAW